jgi:hypothetical protein
MDFIPPINRDRAASIISIASAIAIVYSTLSYVSKRNDPPKGYLKIPESKSSYLYIGNVSTQKIH